MRIDSRISYNELEQLIFVLKDKLKNTWLKNIYHYDGLWELKFNYVSIIYDSGKSLWIGKFKEREDGRNLHSISKKLRKELRGKKLSSINIINNDRTVVLEFKDYKLILELYLQGNMILLDKDNIIIKVHREIKKNGNNSYIREHGMTYNIGEYKNYENYSVIKYCWKVKDYQIIENSEGEFENIFEALKNLWNIK